MKHLIAPALLAAALILAGCSESVPAPAPVPSPDTVQTQNLTAEILKINPILANEKAIDAAKDTCTSILGGTNDADLVKSLQDRFKTVDNPAVTEAEGLALLAAIKSNGFCTPPAPQ